MVRLIFTASLFIAITTPSMSAEQVEWRLLGGNPEAQHFSDAAQINETNVSHLGIVWYADMPTPDGLVGTPLVADGVVFQSGARSIIYANDVRSGKLLWTFDPKVSLDGTLLTSAGALTNRGLALWEDLAIVGTGDCRLVAVERATGKKLWDSHACDPGEQLMITAAPRVGGNKVFTGNANGDVGTGRGHVDAFDARTGRHLWRFYTIPGDPAKGFESAALAKAAKTWGKEWWKKVGGGSVWESMTYDPVLNLLYIGVGGMSPFDPRERGEGRGDELFSNSIVALNADTGEYVWHYQTTPNDAWNLEPTMPIMIATLPVGRKQTRVVMEAPKNGFFYVLDAKTGKLISANNFVPVNWASRIDIKTGRPVELPGARYYENPEGRAVILPGSYGAHSWQPMSYSGGTGLVYIPAMELKTELRIVRERQEVGGSIHYDPVYDAEHARGHLIAWDPVSQKERWSVTLPSVWNGGILSTAGNLVFQGTGSGDFRAYRAKDGKALWSQSLGSGVTAAPVSVTVDGVQTIILPVGSGTSAITARTLARITSSRSPPGPTRLIAFSLDGRTRLPQVARTQPPFESPPLPKPSAALAKRGEQLFTASGCDFCHGLSAIAAPVGSVPDLRRATAQTYSMFRAIVIGGLYAKLGMPSFKDSLTASDVDALQTYVLARAWDSYEAQQTH